MARHAAAAVVLSVLISVPSFAQPQSEHPFCGTSREIREEMRMLSSWVRSSQAKIAPTAIERAGDLLVVPPDEVMAPFDHPVDLEGRSVVLQRRSATTFAVRTTALQFDTQTGSVLKTFENSEDQNESVKYTLQRFTVPFGGQQVRDLYISERIGIFLAPPPATASRQYMLIDSVTLRAAVIGPYLQPNVPSPLRAFPLQVSVRESEDRVIVTWKDTRPPDRPLDPQNSGALNVQAVIERDGDITFSYATLFNVPWGSVVVSTGQPPQRQTIVSSSDPAGDANRASALSDLLDIRRVEVLRSGNTELMSVRLQLGGALRPVGGSAPRASIHVAFDTPSSASGTLVLNSSSTSWQYCVSGVCRTLSDAVEFGADTVTLHFVDRDFAATGPVTVFAQTSEPGRSVDSATASFTLTRGTPIDRDLTALTSGSDVPMPVVEAFTVPILNVDAVWVRVRDELELWDEEVDAVAIYQNFPTDLIQYASAYSTVGNLGADGVWAESEGFIGSDVPRYPATMHMNRIVVAAETEFRKNRRQFLLEHELGHRWLYGMTIAENGETSWVLNPISAHPASYVHTPAAFNVVTQSDYSVMGGSNFRELASDRFATPDNDGAWGYSWHELYLMGLATPSEIGDWFYIADSNPELDLAYNAPPGTTVTGRKVPVRFHQLTESMGARFPAEGESQKEFRLLFVLLQKPSADVEQEKALLNETLQRFPQTFSAATGGRGSIVVGLPVAPQAKMIAPSRAYTGSQVAFRDESSEFPARWRWDFGDGNSSTEQHPRHAYRSPGSYQVTLRVENSRGSSTTTGQVVVERGTRRRPSR